MLYHGRRWVTRVLWISFVLFYVLRWGVTIAGSVPIFRKSKSLKKGPHHEAFPTGEFKYSPIANACYADQTNAVLLGVFLWVVPLAFDVLLVALTSIKAYQNAALLKNTFSSPVVRQFHLMAYMCTESDSPNCPSCILCSAMGYCEFVRNSAE